MATQVLESDDLVDQYRDRIFEQLLEQMTQQTALVVPSMQFILATRHLERIADHATNIAEDIIYWVRGLDVRHGRGLGIAPAGSGDGSGGDASEVTEDSHGLYSDVTARDRILSTLEPSVFEPTTGIIAPLAMIPSSSRRECLRLATAGKASS